MSDRVTDEIITKVGNLVRSRFGGNFKALFDHYSKRRRGSGTIDIDELVLLLQDADIGNGLNRGQYAAGIMRRIDKDNDGYVSFMEFQWMDREEK